MCMIYIKNILYIKSIMKLYLTSTPFLGVSGAKDEEEGGVWRKTVLDGNRGNPNMYIPASGTRTVKVKTKCG